jgi:ABC-type phosphate/phosphonate transport system permease subunit
VASSSPAARSRTTGAIIISAFVTVLLIESLGNWLRKQLI